MHDLHEDIAIGRKILAENDHIAEHNRKVFRERGLFVVNLMGSPGSGKTTLLEKTIPALSGCRVGVIEGDIEGDADKKRVEAAGASTAIQINTFGACHLLAHQIEKALAQMPSGKTDLIFIENVGNLVCPAEFDLGEHIKIAVLGVTEGADKPVKYPLMFRHADALVLNKIDILDQSGCDIQALEQNVGRINPDLSMFKLSSRTGTGIAPWIEWLQCRIRSLKSSKVD